MSLSTNASYVLLRAMTGMTHCGDRRRKVDILRSLDDRIYRDVGLSRIDVLAGPLRESRG